MVWLEIELKSFPCIARFDLSYELYVFESGMLGEKRKNGFRSFWEFAIKKYCMYSTNARSETDVSPWPHIEIGINLKHRLLMTSISIRMMLENYHKSMHNVISGRTFHFNEMNFDVAKATGNKYSNIFKRNGWMPAITNLYWSTYNVNTCEVTEYSECWIEKSTRIVIMWWQMKFEQQSIGKLEKPTPFILKKTDKFYFEIFKSWINIGFGLLFNFCISSSFSSMDFERISC